MEAPVKAKVEVVDGVIMVNAQVDIVEVMEHLAKQSDNTVDDMVVNIVRMAKSNLDWKGYAIEALKTP